MTAIPAIAAPDNAAGDNAARVGVYEAQQGAIVARGLKRYHNRPLYGNQLAAVVLAGDLPHIRFLHEPYIGGCLMIALQRGGKAKWLQDFTEVEFRFHEARVTWNLRDQALPGLELTMDVVPLADAPGFCSRLRIHGAQPGDRLIWAYGGACQKPPGGISGSVASAVDPSCVPAIVTRGFVADDCRGNQVSIQAAAFSIVPPLYDPAAKGPVRTVAGRCSDPSAPTVSDANAWQDPSVLAKGADKPELPLAVGTAALADGDVFWAVESFDASAEGPLPQATSSRIGDPAKSFQAGMRWTGAVASQVVVNTPDERFNASVSAACSALHGLFRPPRIFHGSMSWNVPYMGWRTMYGPTAFGWHEIVRQAAALYIATQEKEDCKKIPRADPGLGYTAEAMDSRFYGLGRLQHPDQWRYDMQSVFYDMVIHAWRWTGDPELEKLLHDSLDLHLRWMKDCFDPDDDGVYESYQNTAEVDQVWYNGGGTAEETAYAYAGHRAAMELARKAGDLQAARNHETRAKKIQEGLMRSLWIPNKGYVGAYREQSGRKRLHEDAWLYSIFLPIDAGMLAGHQPAEALHYTQWGLQRDQMPLGGVRCWTSNWVPGAWSNRLSWPAHAYSLALAYCQAGLPDKAWELMKGGFLESGFNRLVPGSFDCNDIGTDFHDTSSMFARAVVEGIFGYRPDYPNGLVRVTPGFPSPWDHASIKTPDFSLSFKRQASVDEYFLNLSSPADLLFEVPVRAQKILSAEVDGQPADWKCAPGYGHSRVSVHLPKRKSARLTIHWADALPQGVPISIAATVGERVELAVPRGKIVKIEDPQQVLLPDQETSGTVPAAVGRNPGRHLVFALVDHGPSEQWQIIDLQVSDPRAEAAAAAKQVQEIPKDAKWSCVKMDEHFNGDLRAIYKQEYLKPRPPTCSVRIGTNAYSSWPWYFWGVKLPEIDFSNAAKMLDAEGRLITPQGVPFLWKGGERNIAFTSQWDNWPRQVTIPVGRKGKAVWLLLCGTTNPMQGRIANAEIRLHYSDGTTDTLEIMPPLNFWSLCGLQNPNAPQKIDVDYNYQRDGFALPKTPPASVPLGNNCRAILLNRRLREDVELQSLTLETLSQEAVIGLLGLTVME